MAVDFEDLPNAGPSDTLGDELNSRFNALKTGVNLALQDLDEYHSEVSYDKSDVVRDPAKKKWQSLQDGNLGHALVEGDWWTALGSGANGASIWDDIEGRPDEFPPSSHTHLLEDVTDAGTAAGMNASAAGNAADDELVKGDDSRLMDSRTPTAHKSTHASGGSDALSPADIGAATAADLAAHSGASAPHAGHLKADGSVAWTGQQNAGGNRLSNLGTPTSAADAVTKQYADALASGLSIKAAVKVATTGNLASLSGLLTIDAVTLLANDRVLVKNQTTGSENGIYLAQSGAWSRAADADTSGELPGGTVVFVEFGNTHQKQRWVMITPGITLGTTAQEWTQDAASGIGEANTSSNVGSGTGLFFKIKSGLNFVFRSLKIGSNKLSIANNEDDVTIDVVEENLSLNNIGGALGPTKGGTGLTAFVLGELLYASAVNSLSRLSGNTTVTRKFLGQVGDGTNSTAPAWNALQPNDYPVFGSSGSAHARGAVPDPGATPGILRFLREDGTWNTAGTRWTNGTGAPTSGTGSDGDYYWRTTTGDVYKKTSGAWSIVGNIKGPTGPPGGVTVEQVAGRGANAIANGFGEFGNNYNFTNFVYDALNVRSSAGSFKITSAGTSGSLSETDEFIPVDADKFYRLSAWAKVTNLVADNNYGCIGLEPCDSDKLGIKPYHYARIANTDTTLAAPLAPGDATIQLSNANNWKNSNSDQAHSRQIILWGYRNAAGYIYPANTYSRLTSINHAPYAPTDLNDSTLGGAWDGGGIAAGVITLRVAWPATLGNPVNKTSGGEPAWPTGAGASVFDGSVKWTEAGAPVGGEAAWSAETAFALNSYVVPSVGNGHRYQAVLVNIWPAGTPVSNSTTGGTYRYVAALNVQFPETWTKYSGIIGGVSTNGVIVDDKFPPGTAFVKALFLANRSVNGRNGTAGNSTNFADISLSPAIFASDVVNFTEAAQDILALRQEPVALNLDNAPNCALSNYFRATLAADDTLLNPINAADARAYFFEILSSGDPDATLSFGSKFAFAPDVTFNADIPDTQRWLLSTLRNEAADKFYIVDAVQLA